MADFDTSILDEPLPPELAPEPPPKGPVVWMRENLFGGETLRAQVINGALTVISVVVVSVFIRGILSFILDPERRWSSVATNMRLLMVQAYPQDQMIRWWVTIGTVLVLAGLSLAVWRVGGEMPVANITRSVMGTAGFVAYGVLLAPLAVSTKVTWWIILAVILGGAYGVARWYGDRAKTTTVPTLLVVLALIIVALLGIWLIPFGQHAFTAGEVQPVVSGTIAETTKVPWTVVSAIGVVAYLIGLALRDRVKAGTARGVMSLTWLLAMPVLTMVVLRDPDLDWDRIWGEHIWIGLAFAVVGGALMLWLANPTAGEAGRLAAGGVLVGAIAVWFIPGVVMQIRVLLAVMALFSLLAPTFAGEASARRRYTLAWVGAVLVTSYFIVVTNGTTTVQVPGDSYLGGLSLTFVVAIFGILLSFPIGVIMALGRTSSMPIFRVLSTVYIEVIRGIPFITVLIFFAVILPLFLPANVNLDEIVVAIIATTLFSGAYMAENVRGGLQAIRKGQYEASNALGMSTVQTTAFIVLPQALRTVIPPLVGQAIGMFKDTSLLAIIGLFDFLRIANSVIPTQTEFLGAKREALLFISLIYWIFTFSLSRSSLRLEKKLGLGER